MIADCSWDQPGHNPFMGDVVAAVAHYDLPEPAQRVLQERMAKRQYDDLVEITHDKISGRYDYIALRMMHFGQGQICANPRRDKWGSRVERALVYCIDDTCVLVPTVCRNVSLVTRVLRTALPPIDPEQPGGVPGLTDFPPVILWSPPVNTPAADTPSSLSPPVWTPPSPPPMRVVLVGSTPFIPPKPPIPAVPDIPTWVGMLLGLATLARKLK
jgi:hypothetical protein